MMIIVTTDGVSKVETKDGWVDYVPNTEIPSFVDAAFIAKGIQQTTNTESMQYLASTDWYITRQAETGATVPTDVLTKRAEARAAVVPIV
tara:strand:- start:49 stop:318 length:270 start_codon:yes stop_codon:yes gene_type:complete